MSVPANPVLASVIIPAWNGERFLANCLKSLRQQTCGAYEVIVVDNGSGDSTRIIAQQYVEVRVVPNLSNLGFARAVNQGLRVARGDILFLLNQDTVALSDWLSPIAELLQHDDQLGIVGCRLLYPDGRAQHTGARLIEPSWDTEHLREADTTKPMDYVTGAAMAIRRACFAYIGEFDEGFFPAYCEDVDYCLRARALGWGIAYEPRAVFTHFESQSRGDTVDFLVSINAQRLRLVLKHRPTSWILSTFIPFEQARIAHQLSREWLLAMAHSYLCATSDAGALAQWRTQFYNDDESIGAVSALADGLLGLRQQAMARALRLMESF